jgi:hypothetical protein
MVRWSFIGVLILATGAAADDLVQFDELMFHIPSQPLPSALQTYSHVSGVQVLYESRSAEGRRSAEVEGAYTRDAALRLLLSDTDLVIRYTRANAITLAPASAQNADAPPIEGVRTADFALETLHMQATSPRDDLSRLREYSRVIENDVQQALKKNPRTKQGNYSVGVKLWIDPSRTIRRAELFRSSGDQARDAAIAAVLGGLLISQASPPDTPQPVTLVISVNSLL